MSDTTSRPLKSVPCLSCGRRIRAYGPDLTDESVSRCRLQADYGAGGLIFVSEAPVDEALLEERTRMLVSGGPWVTAQLVVALCDPCLSAARTRVIELTETRPARPASRLSHRTLAKAWRRYAGQIEATS